ncbi:MAG: FAD-dependent oxidoreductase [Nocardioidaceae bacterium]|nr:FAD-dependent oxidoreductase [Nocardioidaceae bacterium]
MPYVVTQSCCSDASCVLACPVNCIHPAPGEPGFAEAEMLYVDPRACVDCGACATACPVDALKPHTTLTEAELPFVELNRLFYAEHPHADRTPLALVPQRRGLVGQDVRVAVVGAGPAGLYAADELLKHPGVTVDVYDRLPTPYGLVRAGVAPDHQHTKQVTQLFAAIEGQPGFRYRLGVEVGRDVTHEELERRYHAVFHTVGAAADRTLDIPGEDLLGSVSATEVVGWYNGHPDHADVPVDLGGERVVVVGNGNVALDVARVLTADPVALAATDLADLPLATLRGSRVREVVVLGRRGPAEAAFTLPELVGLAGLRDVDVVVESAEPFDLTTPKGRLLAELAVRPRREGVRRIVLRFRTAPARILGADAVTGVEVEHTLTGELTTIEASLVIRSIGYRGRPVAGLPFDEVAGVVPHQAGRVRPGVYVAGWVKRGPSGFIGTNKSCAEESVSSFLEDLAAGALVSPAEQPRAIPGEIDLDGWRAIDAEERRRGALQGRPRVKLDVAEQTTIAHAARPRGKRALRLRP